MIVKETQDIEINRKKKDIYIYITPHEQDVTQG